MYLGWLITLFILLPNLIYVRFPPRDAPAADPNRDTSFKVMEGIERVGQVGCFIIPCFYRIPPLDGVSVASLVLMAGSLIFYYAGWLRYLRGGRSFHLLYSPMMNIPYPMAAAPILYFLSAAALLYSWPLGLAAILLAAGHLYVSQHEYQRTITS